MSKLLIQKRTPILLGWPNGSVPAVSGGVSEAHVLVRVPLKDRTSVSIPTDPALTQVGVPCFGRGVGLRVLPEKVDTTLGEAGATPWAKKAKLGSTSYAISKEKLNILKKYKL